MDIRLNERQNKQRQYTMGKLFYLKDLVKELQSCAEGKSINATCAIKLQNLDWTLSCKLQQCKMQ